QLSHNAIAGEDDPEILRELYERIENVDLKLYAGLDDATLELPKEVRPPSISEVNLQFRNVSIVFLPDDLERAQEAWAEAKAVLSKADETWLASMADYDDWLDTIEAAQASHDIKNVATALMLVLDLARKHITELEEGWRPE